MFIKKHYLLLLYCRLDIITISIKIKIKNATKTDCFHIHRASAASVTHMCDVQTKDRQLVSIQRQEELKEKQGQQAVWLVNTISSFLAYQTLVDVISFE